MPEKRGQEGFRKSARYSRVVIAFTPTGTHLNMAQLVFLIAALLVPAVMLARYWTTRKKIEDGALKGSRSIDALSPFPVVQRVRKAFLAGQVDNVRDLLSDPLYQRLKASPPPGQVPSGPVLLTRRQMGDDPNRVMVRLSRGVTVSGAEAEEWAMRRLPTAGMSTPPPTQVAGGWIVEEIRAAGA